MRNFKLLTVLASVATLTLAAPAGAQDGLAPPDDLPVPQKQ